MRTKNNISQPTKAQRRVAGFGRALALMALGCCLTVPGLAAASGDNEVHVIQKIPYDNANTFELSVFGVAQVNSRFSNGIGAGLSFAYQFSQYVGLEAMGVYNILAAETGTSQDLADRLQVAASGAERSRANWFGTLAFRFVPFYGKFSFFGLNTAFLDLYLVAGGAVVGTDEGVLSQRNSEDQSLPYAAGRINPGGVLGVGLRLFATRNIVVRLEVRDVMYAVQGANAKDRDNTDDPSKQLQETTLRNNVYMLLGVGFVF